MMRPEEISLAEILAPTDAFETTIDALYRFGAVEIESKPVPGAECAPWTGCDPARMARAKEDLSTLSRALEIIGAEPSEELGTTAWSQIPEAVRDDVALARSIVDAEAEHIEAKRRCAAARLENSFFAWLSAIGIPPSLCAPSERMAVLTGTVLAASRAISLPKDAIVEWSSPAKDVVFVALAVPKRDEAEARAILTKGGFVAIDPLLGDGHVDRSEAALDLTRTRLRDYEGAAPRLASAYAALEGFIHAADEAMRARATRRCAYISCWIPTGRAREFADLLAASLGDRCALHIVPAERAIQENAFCDEEIPSILRRRRFLEPFRLIVSIYGCPAYRHVDPLPVSALGFLAMFGMMFADIGHGAVIASSGLALRFVSRSRTLRDTGMLMLYAGIASAVGGLVFGSVFGREDIVPPLWFSPMEDTDLFLILGVASGLAMISAGILLNIAQKLWQHDIAGALFSPWGILTLGFYWSCAAALGQTLGGETIPLPLPLLLTAIALPVIALVIGGAVTAARRGKNEAAEIAFRPVEIVLGLLSNTVSFVRVSAFGLTHIALMTAVYLITSTMTPGSLSSTSVAVEGNLFVLLLEGLIVTIQCLRLQFYEFYSKFFDTTGRAFAPIRKNSVQGALA